MYRFFVSLLVLSLIFQINTFSQDISLFRQFNGRYDYEAIGNTLNVFENNIDQSFCETLPSSQATLNLPAGSNIIAAYLYWAGSGTGDQQVTLNNNDFEANETYLVDYDDPDNGLLTYFSSYADITHFIQSEGNVTYTFENLDISETLFNNPGYCNNRTNFAGWCIYVIVEYYQLPLNQINLFQGLEIINRNVQEKIIILNNINVLDTDNAKIGFLAWEGDAILNLGETVSINNNILQNPPLNLSNNAFNGTNTFTYSNTFYNCDLDVYSIQNNIQVGDETAEIKLTTQADLIIINNIITVLNSQLPDATIQIDDLFLECGSREIEIDYAIYNTNSTEILPESTPIAFYADGELIGTSETQNPIEIGEFESQTIILNIPNTIADNFLLMVVVDDDGMGNGIVLELNEINNSTNETIQLIVVPPIIQLEPLDNCNEGFNSALFDLTLQLDYIEYTSIDSVSFYLTLDDLMIDMNEILNPENFFNTIAPQTIYIRVDNSICFEMYQFNLQIENCPPFIPQVFTPNNDGFNDWFNIQGLYDIFERHDLLIYNRYGTLIFEGNNTIKWDGKANKGINNKGRPLPIGTYFYVLNLSDPNYKIMTGWVYLTK